ncbi:cytochrome P450, putative [Pediculus humanus corporis]|uniref:Cytochrome P450, putative n=1 Tax=Pediculus humanus subsp. corporis TaxID=121224 RepID=E0VUR0_PEDHC|nr:cytochrome P450, putative [Pediculus humanus corporis]EEB17116.1 cytochrome P450, putative [Pediculus humanus corporis]
MFESLIILFILIFIFHLFIYHEYHLPKYVNLINKIPGPVSHSYFGSSLKFYRLKHEEILYDLIEGFKKWGPTYRLWYSGVAVVFVSDLEDVQTILSSREANAKGMLYRNILPWLGCGLLTSCGEKWQKMRKIITPAFHFTVLCDYIEIFNKNTKIMLDVLKKKKDDDEGKKCDLSKYLTRCTLDNICETAMGTSINALRTGSESKYVKAIFRMGQIVVERMFSPLHFTNMSFMFSLKGLEHSRLLKILHGFTYEIINEKMMNLIKEKSGGRVEKKTGNVYKTKSSFLDILLENQKIHCLSFEDIRQEVDTFMFEGHDTTAASLTWTLFELGHHPEVQERCYSELIEIFGDSNELPSYNDLMKMNYLKRVIQETLRLYPSVPVISRKFKVDMQLNDYLVPANTEIILILYAIQRNEKIFKNPDKFDPDRFLQEEIIKRHAFAYVPFSAGQRNCIGQKFAMLEELVVLSSIIRNFKIESLNDRNSIRVVPEMILRPHQNLKFKLIKRQ